MHESAPKHSPDSVPVTAELPKVWVPIGFHEIAPRLETAARRGKFAGFRHGQDAVAFRVHDFGGPFESVLSARADGAGGGGTTLAFTLSLRTGLAWVYFATLILTVWPGVWLTDSMLRTYFTGYNYQTWMWYIPLTAPFVPWAMWTAIRRSRARGRVAAEPIFDSIAAALGGRVIRDEGPAPDQRIEEQGGSRKSAPAISTASAR